MNIVQMQELMEWRKQVERQIAELQKELAELKAKKLGRKRATK